MLSKIWIICITLSACLLSAHAEVTAQDSFKITCGPPIAERLAFYFSRSETRPRHIVYNEIDPGPTKKSIEKIELGGVIFEWIVAPKEKRDVDIAIKINGHRIELKEQKPINPADGDRTIGPELISTWDQVRLYDLGGDRKIIALTLRPRMCTGLMCSVAAQLYFDLKSKQTSFFGSYQTDGDAKLFSFGQDGSQAFVVATNFVGDPHGGSESVITYALYRLLPDGKFVRENYFMCSTA